MNPRTTPRQSSLTDTFPVRHHPGPVLLFAIAPSCLLNSCLCREDLFVDGPVQVEADGLSGGELIPRRGEVVPGSRAAGERAVR